MRTFRRWSIDSPLQDGQQGDQRLLRRTTPKAVEMAAQELAKLLGDKGKVIVLKYQEGSSSTMLREQGFFDEMKKHPGITDRGPGVRRRDLRLGTGEGREHDSARLSRATGLSIDGIYAVNESTDIRHASRASGRGRGRQGEVRRFRRQPQAYRRPQRGPDRTASSCRTHARWASSGVKAVVDKLHGQTGRSEGRHGRNVRDQGQHDHSRRRRTDRAAEDLIADASQGRLALGKEKPWPGTAMAASR